MALITITQSMGSAGEEIAKLVAATLNLELYDDNKLQQTAQSMGKELDDLKQFDEKAPGFFQFAFHRAWNDLSLFDLVISTEKMTPPSAAEIIVAAAQNQEVKTCSLTALDAMDRLSLEKKIDSVLLKNSFNPLYIHVTVPEKGVALVRGLTESDDDLNRLRKIVGAIDGVREVRYEVSVRPAVLI
jgi:hypothetical protein